MRDHHQLLTRSSKFLDKPHGGGIRANYDDMLLKRGVHGTRLSHG
jgi:hypothetical protein